jgi:sec-independent protein translocase protein TatC
MRLRLPLHRRHRDPEGRMPVMSHLRELRRRVITALVIVAAGAIAGWVFYDPILSFLKHPYCSVPYQHRFPGTDTGCHLVFTQVLAGFTTRLKVSFIAGAVLTSPLWLYQIWAFITPGLRKNERKYTLVFIAASSTLFAAGVALAYAVLTRGLRFVLGTAGSGTQSLLTIDSYLSFVTLLLIVFGIALELPLLVVMANLVGVLPARWLRKSQRVAIFLIFLFAAVATPTTDPFTMTAMAVPMVLLFEGAVVFAVIHDRRKARRKAEEAARSQESDDVASRIDPIPRRLDESWTETT